MSWFGVEYSEEFSEESEEFSRELSEDYSKDFSPLGVSESDAFRLASSARGGGRLGFWFPGQRARRRRNVAKMKQRAVAKKEGVSAGGGDVSPHVVYWCRDRQIRIKQMLGANTRLDICKTQSKGAR